MRRAACRWTTARTTASCAWSSLEHLPAPLTLLGEIRRVLERRRAGPSLSVPNPYSWVEVYRELFRRPDPEGHLNAFTTPVIENLLALAGLKLERRLGTSIRLPRTLRLVSTDSILARSRIYVVRPAERVVFAGRSSLTFKGSPGPADSVLDGVCSLQVAPLNHALGRDGKGRGSRLGLLRGRAQACVP